MKKNIKDYLHLYLGCEVSVTNLDGRFRRINNYDFFSEYYDWDEGEFMNDPKLILRPLSCITEEEDSQFKKVNRGHWIDMHWYPEGFLWLLSKHFDVFNLIPEGLAIDATTLKTKE